MRKAIDGLAGMVEQHFKPDPFGRARTFPVAEESPRDKRDIRA
jgi:hypothetical protein